MQKLGKKRLTLELQTPIDEVPEALSGFDLELAEEGGRLIYSYDGTAERTGITRLMTALTEAGICFRDLQTEQSSLEDIFVELVGEKA